MLFLLLQIDPANFEGLKSRLEQKDKEICALKQAAKVRIFYICLFVYKYVHSGPKCGQNVQFILWGNLNSVCVKG